MIAEAADLEDELLSIPIESQSEEAGLTYRARPDGSYIMHNTRNENDNENVRLGLPLDSVRQRLLQDGEIFYVARPV